MKTTRRRYWVYFLLFLFSAIAYVDRVNMSVAGKPIAHEFGLSPVALGYLFSSFLWAYVLMMLPGGRLIDRWGAHVVASVATAVWSRRRWRPEWRQFCDDVDGAARSGNRRGAVRSDWSYQQRPVMVALYRARHRDCRDLAPVHPRACARRSGRRLADREMSWRWSFIITGAVGFRLGSGLGGRWSRRRKRRRGCSRNRSATTSSPGATPASSRRATAASAISGLIRKPAMWGLFISQGCLVYTLYLYLSWLPNYLQTARGMSVMGSGIYTAMPFFVASLVNIVANWIGDLG